jgi:hypothetical protein
MPFKSEKQRRYLWMHEPALAKAWSDKYGSKPIHNDDKKVEEAMNHPDFPGEGAKKRRAMKLNPAETLHAIMAEHKRGTLRSGSGEHVKDRKQAIAIALHESGLSHKTPYHKLAAKKKSAGEEEVDNSNMPMPTMEE